jgi:hypothetical protein
MHRLNTVARVAGCGSRLVESNQYMNHHLMMLKSSSYLSQSRISTQAGQIRSRRSI